MTATLDDGSQLLLARCLYWAMPAVVMLWTVAAVRRWRAGSTSITGFVRRHRAGLLVALLVTLAAPWLSPPQMRMQFDETSLCGTAQNMHLHRTAMMGVAAVPGADGALEFTDWNLDKRPPLFPFLVSVAHDLTGYRVANAFAVNLVALFGLLATLAVAGRTRAGPWGGVAAPLLVLAVPLVLVTATSAGFELLGTLLLCWVVLAALDYLATDLAEPSAARGQWLLANGLLYAQVRYESVFVFGLVLGLCWWRRRRLSLGRSGVALLAVTPVLLLPVLLLLWHSRDPGFYLEAGGRELIALGNAATNIGPFVARFFAPGVQHAFPGPLAIVSVIVYALWLRRRRGSFCDVVVLAPVGAVTAIVWLWFYGDVREATALRLYLPVCVLAALGPLLLLAMFRPRWLGPVVAFCALGLAVPRVLAVQRGDILPQHETARLLDQIDGVLAVVPKGPGPAVWVTTVSQYLIVHGRAAIPPRAFPVRAARTAAATVLLLTHPLDPILAGWFGDPADVLRSHPADQLGRAEDPASDAAITVYRLRR